MTTPTPTPARARRGQCLRGVGGDPRLRDRARAGPAGAARRSDRRRRPAHTSSGNRTSRSTGTGPCPAAQLVVAWPPRPSAAPATGAARAVRSRSARPASAERPTPRRRRRTGVRRRASCRSASSTRRPGRSAVTRARTAGNRAAPTQGVVISDRLRWSMPRSAPIAARADPTPATISRACRAKTSPAAVGVAGRRVRSSSRTPSCRSSEAMCALTRDCERWTCSDAAVNPPRSTTARKVSSQSRSTRLEPRARPAGFAPGLDPRIPPVKPQGVAIFSMRVPDGLRGMTRWCGHSSLCFPAA